MTESRQQSSHRTRKIAAIAAGLLVVGVGATYTLASWTDSEWVWGGAGDEAGIGTTSFNVQQNTTSPFNNEVTAAADPAWGDYETAPGGSLAFSPGAIALSPGDSTYAPVALRTAPGSEAALINLESAVANPDATVPAGVTLDSAGEGLWTAVDLKVYTQTITSDSDPDFQPTISCGAGFTEVGWDLIASGPLTSDSLEGQEIVANSGSVQHYCFVLTLPDTESIASNKNLQGHAIAPAWKFTADSVTPAP